MKNKKLLISAYQELDKLISGPDWSKVKKYLTEFLTNNK